MMLMFIIFERLTPLVQDFWHIPTKPKGADCRIEVSYGIAKVRHTIVTHLYSHRMASLAIPSMPLLIQHSVLPSP